MLTFTTTYSGPKPADDLLLSDAFDDLGPRDQQRAKSYLAAKAGELKHLPERQRVERARRYAMEEDRTPGGLTPALHEVAERFLKANEAKLRGREFPERWDLATKFALGTLEHPERFSLAVSADAAHASDMSAEQFEAALDFLTRYESQLSQAKMSMRLRWRVARRVVLGRIPPDQAISEMVCGGAYAAEQQAKPPTAAPTSLTSYTEQAPGAPGSRQFTADHAEKHAAYLRERSKDPAFRKLPFEVQHERAVRFALTGRDD